MFPFKNTLVSDRVLKHEYPPTVCVFPTTITHNFQSMLWKFIETIVSHAVSLEVKY